MIRMLLLSICLLLAGERLSAENGSRLWLRQDTTANAKVECSLHSPTLDIACSELKRTWKGTPVSLELFNDATHTALGPEGYTIRSGKTVSHLGPSPKKVCFMPPITSYDFKQPSKTLSHSISKNVRRIPYESSTIGIIWTVPSNVDMPDIHFGNGTNCQRHFLPVTKHMPVPTPPSVSMLQC